MKIKAPAVVSDINVTPMVDVMLVLLIIFMVITPMLTKGVQVEMVRAKNPIAMADADKDDAILVAVSKAGDVFLGSAKTKVDEIGGKVKDLLTNRLDKICFMKCDRRARYERVVEVVDAIRSAGIDQLGLIVEAVDSRISSTGKGGA